MVLNDEKSGHVHRVTVVPYRKLEWLTDGSLHRTEPSALRSNNRGPRSEQPWNRRQPSPTTVGAGHSRQHKTLRRKASKNTAESWSHPVTPSFMVTGAR